MPEKPPRVLIADDQPEVLSALSVICSAEGYEVTSVDSPPAVISRIENQDLDLVLMDLNYAGQRTSGEEGLDLLKEIRRIDPSLPVIAMTAWGSIPLAVEAIRLGARDFLQKPWENERLLSILRTQIELRDAIRGRERLEGENRVLRSDQGRAERFVAFSAEMKQLEHLIEQVAPSDANVLITGENGTGKGVVARLVHKLSLRSAEPLISVNMGGIPEGLFESEMFGHVKGAFTDARADRAGRFELADKGTLFLDEISNLSGSQQAKMLRVLETGEFERIGSSKTRRADVRILSATNADLAKEIESEKFREDLFFRLNTIEIHVPALRERTEDLPELARFFLNEVVQRYRKTVRGLSAEALRALKQYPWPGNIRELRHVIERAVLLTKSSEIQAIDLGLHTPQSKASTLDEMDLESVEAHLIRKALDRHGGNAVLAAKALGLSRSAFYRRVQKHRLEG
jgi:DNA-binding NtrC family response regulator